MSLRLTTGTNDLSMLVLDHPSGSTADLYLHGAHLTSWVPAGGDEAIFVSRDARFAHDEAIRGGVPVVFPQFADLGPLTKHGFARTAHWEWVEPPSSSEDLARAVLRLSASEATRAHWPYDFEAEYTVELGAQTLKLTLVVRNADTRPFSFTGALHTYLRLADVRQTVIEGLHHVHYLDRTEGGRRRLDTDPALVITGEVDRAYLGVPSAVHVRDQAAGRAFHVHADGFTDVVVWNPWAAGAAKLPDMGADEYETMVCIEAAQVGEPVTVQPGTRWQGVQRLEIEAETGG